MASATLRHPHKDHHLYTQVAGDGLTGSHPGLEKSKTGHISTGGVATQGSYKEDEKETYNRKQDSAVGSPTVNVLLPDSVKTGFLGASTSKGLKLNKKRSRTATMAKRQRRAKKRLRREETADSELDLDGYGAMRGSAKAVIMNNRVMSATHDVTHKGVVSLYNNGFFPKKGGRVARESNFARMGQVSKLYATSGQYGFAATDGFITSASNGDERAAMQGRIIY